jgi:hypothetical protein
MGYSGADPQPDGDTTLPPRTQTRSRPATAARSSGPPRWWPAASGADLLEPVAGRPGQALITTAFGCYQLSLPDGAWVDLHAVGTGRVDRAAAEALVASMISRRPFLAGVDGNRASALLA